MAYQFNGSNQYLSTTSAPISEVPCTLACWFNVPNVNIGATTIFDVNANAANSQFILYYWNNTLRIASINNAGTSADASLSISGLSNTWVHAAGVFSSNTNRVAYVNGSGGTANTASNTPSGLNTVRIGTRYFRGLGAYFPGIMAEVGVWNVALTAAEIASLAKGMTCDKIRPQNLVFYAPLIRDLVDAKGGLTITNNNGTTVANHPRVYA
jgi:hypothetical protein